MSCTNVTRQCHCSWLCPTDSVMLWGFLRSWNFLSISRLTHRIRISREPKEPCTLASRDERDLRAGGDAVCRCHYCSKLRLTTWRTLHTSQPLYRSELISHYLPSRSLRSPNTNLLTRPPGITSNFSSRAFPVFAPSTWSWNSQPAHIRSIHLHAT